MATTGNNPRLDINIGTKFDAGKSRIDLIEPGFILGLGRILAYGAVKYSEGNWKQGIETKRIYAAAMRHLLAFHSGELLDRESGLPHLHHAAVNLMMADWNTEYPHE